MKILFFDCTNGISGDMVLKALMDLSGQRDEIEEALKEETLHSHHHTHGRSWLDIREIINYSGFSDIAKSTALSIYRNIAVAEAQVHGETLETIHFHEVGRDEAIRNALGTGMALEAIKPDLILTSSVCDGKGTIVCSHGEIPVPVPAVKALMQKCSYDFRRADVDTEMVTPSGLASLMGIEAKPAFKTLQQLLQEPEVCLIAETEARGSRNTGRDGLRVYLIMDNNIRKEENQHDHAKKLSEDL